MSENPRGEKGAPALHRMMAQAVLALVFGIALAALADLVLSGRTLWYWTPVTEPIILKLYALATDPKQYDVVVIGSSVSDRAFIPAAMEEELNGAGLRPEPWLVYNASVEGAFLSTYADIMRSIVGKWQKPRLILLSLGVRDFNACGLRQAREIRFFTKYPEDYWLVLRHGGRLDQRFAAAHALLHGLESLLQYPMFASAAYPEAVKNYQDARGGVYAYPLTPEAGEKNRATLPGEDFKLDEMMESRANVALNKLLNDFRINAMIEGWLRRTIAASRQKGVKLVILFGPESDWFAKKVYKGEREAAVAFLSRICKEEGVTWIDLGQPPFRPSDREYFDGCDHLGPEGATRISRIVAKEIVVPALAGAKTR